MPATLPPSPPRTPSEAAVVVTPRGAVDVVVRGAGGAVVTRGATAAAGREAVRVGVGVGLVFGAGAVVVRVLGLGRGALVELVVGFDVPPAMTRSAEPVSPLQVKETEYRAPRLASRSTVIRAVCPRAMLTVSKTPEEAVAYAAPQPLTESTACPPGATVDGVMAKPKEVTGAASAARAAGAPDMQSASAAPVAPALSRAMAELRIAPMAVLRIPEEQSRSVSARGGSCTSMSATLGAGPVTRDQERANGARR
ncbi:hypothetical protein GCM10010493_71980 [Streptomyces lavendulae subsp. grasserius]